MTFKEFKEECITFISKNFMLKPKAIKKFNTFICENKKLEIYYMIFKYEERSFRLYHSFSGWTIAKEGEYPPLTFVSMGDSIEQVFEEAGIEIAY